MAYVTESTLETGKYDLYIGARDGVIANENSNHLFFCFTRIEKINFGYNYDTSNVTTMNQMFINCRGLEKLNLCSFETNNVIDMSAMFYNTPKIQIIFVSSNWTTENASTTIGNMFGNSAVTSVTTGQCPTI